MNWTADKQAHYKKSFNWSRTGFVLGLWTIAIFLIAGLASWWISLFPLIGAILILGLGAAKEVVYDKWMHKGHAEWADMKANLIGVMDGLMLWKKNMFSKQN